jgi:hypothetical protein
MTKIKQLLCQFKVTPAQFKVKTATQLLQSAFAFRALRLRGKNFSGGTTHSSYDARGR